jgi:hypothetical protein
MAARPQKRHLSPKARHALELLASNPLGTTEAFMLAHGFTAQCWPAWSAPDSQRQGEKWSRVAAGQSRLIGSRLRPQADRRSKARVAANGQAPEYHGSPCGSAFGCSRRHRHRLAASGKMIAVRITQAGQNALAES